MVVPSPFVFGQDFNPNPQQDFNPNPAWYTSLVMAPILQNQPM